MTSYIFFHDQYIKNALKGSLLNGKEDTSYQKYIDCIDHFFMIKTISEENMNSYCYDWYENQIPYTSYTLRKSLNLLLEQFNSTIDNPQLCKFLYNKTYLSNPIGQEIKSSINQLLSSVTNVQKYIRKNRAIKKYSKKYACRILQSYIRKVNAQLLVEKLREEITQEKKFKVDPDRVTIPELNCDVWRKIISFSMQSLASLFLVNTNLKEVIITVIADIKESIAKDSDDNQFIQAIQALDGSIEFYSRSYQGADSIPFSPKAEYKQNHYLKIIDIPLNPENRGKIKVIRQFISAINKDRQPSDEIAAQLQLKHYCFFYDQYFSYALKALAYIDCLNALYLEKYLECFDENFYIEIARNFIREHYGNCRPNYGSKSSLLEEGFNTYNPAIINVSRPNQVAFFGNETVKIRMHNFLLFLKTERGGIISNSIISYFDNPTRLKKKILFDHEIALTKAQSSIRTHNCKNILNQLKYNKALADAATTVQAYIRRFLVQKTLKQQHRQDIIKNKEIKFLEHLETFNNQRTQFNTILTTTETKLNTTKTKIVELKNSIAETKKLYIIAAHKKNFESDLDLLSAKQPNQSIYHKIKSIIYDMKFLSYCVMQKLKATFFTILQLS